MIKSVVLVSTLFLYMLIFSGCTTISETFGKEYIMVDDFYDQLEADMQLSYEEYTKYGITDNDIELVMDTVKAGIKIDRAELKAKIPGLKEYLEELGYNSSVENFIELSLAEKRLELQQELEKPDGKFQLKHAKIERGFIDSVWHFVRVHWLIILLVMGALNAIYEKITEFFSSASNKNNSQSE